MLKNVRDLNEKEIISLKAAYKKYFDEYAARPVPGFMNKLHNFNIKINSTTYVNMMLEKLLNDDDRVGIVDISGLDINAFISGRIYEDGAAWISHFYIDRELYGNVRRNVTLTIFQAFAKMLKEHKAKTVQTEASYYDPRFIDALETLYFEQKEEYEDDAVLYEKQL